LCILLPWTAIEIATNEDNNFISQIDVRPQHHVDRLRVWFLLLTSAAASSTSVQTYPQNSSRMDSASGNNGPLHTLVWFVNYPQQLSACT
jgi:hypothetical protein